MTEQKTAGYFDQKRNCPMYEGDVYVLPYSEPEFFKIVKEENSGFRVQQVGTQNKYLLSEFGKKLVEEGQFIGNEIENVHTIDDYLKTKNVVKEAVAEVLTDEQPAPAVQELLDKEENTSEVSTTEAPEENKEGEAENVEQICSTDSDGTDAELSNTADANSTISVGTEPKGNEPAKPAETNEQEISDKPNLPAETKSNVIIEKAAPSQIEVIANTADEKQALLRVKLLEKHITENSAEIITLQEKVEYHKDLASTLEYEPFIKLKNLVSEALHTNVDDENIKGIKERTKDFESIVNIQNLLKEHERLAAKYEQDIADLKDEISKFETEKAELNEKIDTFAAQTKLPLTDAE